jgi:glycosyltransferase involved in cell wall biosynthesis
MKTVAIVINTAWNIYNFRLNLARRLRDEGYNVICIAPYNEHYTAKIEKEFSFYAIAFDAKGMNPFNDIKTVWDLYWLYRKIKPDVVLNYTIKPNLYSTWAARLVGAKVINTISGLGTVFIKTSFATTFIKQLYKITSKLTYKVFFQNKDDCELFCHQKLVSPHQAEIVFGSGVDLKRFYPRPSRLEDNKIVFLLVARMLKDKGVYEFIEASQNLYKRYPYIECWLLGACDVQNKTAISQEEMQHLCKKQPLKYLGTSDCVEDIIQQADCIVLPSYREGTPRSLLEAAAMAKPLIATDTVGCKDVIDNEVTGFLCRVRDPEDLMKKMEHIVLLSRKQRENMGRQGLLKIRETYDEKAVIECYLKAIKELLFYNK